MPKRLKTVLIIIPAFNEQRTLLGVIKDLRRHGYSDIVVIDDGSRDKTSTIAKKAKVQLLRHVVNRGLGAALGTGLLFAKRGKYPYAITFDGDGQHKAKDVTKLVLKLKKGESDVVIGSRMLGRRSMPIKRRLLNNISNIVTLVLYGVWSTDSLSGLRAFNRVAIEAIDIRTDRMEVSNEFFKEIKKNNLRFIEVPIQTVYTKYSMEHSQNLDPISIGVKMIFRLFR